MFVDYSMSAAVIKPNLKQSVDNQKPVYIFYTMKKVNQSRQNSAPFKIIKQYDIYDMKRKKWAAIIMHCE